MSKSFDFASFVKPLLQKEKEKSLEGNGLETVHIFRREYSYSCYGYHAIALAEEYYQTKRVVRIDQGLECLDISRKMLSTIGGSLIDRQFRIKLWYKPTPSPIGPWELKLEASQGNFSSLEEEVGKLDRDVTSSCYQAGIVMNLNNPCYVGVCLVSTVTNKIHLFEYEDNSDYTK